MITLHNVHFQYNRRKEVFKNLDLQLEAGRIYGLLGKNAAGKSTLLRLMSGLLSPTSGNCEVNGFSSKRRQPAFLAEVFLIPEEIWLPEMKIGKYIETHAPFYPKFDRDQFYNLKCLKTRK
jgi:ABC-2 type transport system ATP-binding protein